MTPSSLQFLRSGPSALRALCLCLLVMPGCSSVPRTYETAFSSGHQLKGNSDSMPAACSVAWGAAMEVLSQQGFLIQQADATNKVILATREVRDEDDDERSYTVSATLTLIPTTEHLTRVLLAANQTTEMHTQEHTWWHLLWLIPVFPTGTEYTTVVVDRDTVRSPQFYVDFFDAIRTSCAGQVGSAQVAARP